MVYGLWNSAAGMAANQYRLNVTANNLANVDTVGFKHDLALLRHRSVEVKEDPETAAYSHALLDLLSGGTHVKPTLHSFAQGPAMTTGQPLDAMIDGSGFFQIKTPDGVRYSRDGRFTLNAEGTMVTVAGGFPVLDEAGAEINVGPGPQPQIDARGRIYQGDDILGSLGVVEFDDNRNLRKIGKNLFIATSGAVPKSVDARRIVPGTVEGSTVNPVNGLAEMIKVSRSFQMNANLVSLQDQTLGRAVNEIARF